MTTSLNSAVAYQDFIYKAAQCIIGTLNFDSAATVTLGGLPAGAAIIGVVVVTTTAFNATTTNTISVGIINASGTATAAYAVSAQDITAAGPKNVTLASTCLPLATNSTITCAYGQSGTAATAGQSKVIVRFVGP